MRSLWYVISFVFLTWMLDTTDLAPRGQISPGRMAGTIPGPNWNAKYDRRIAKTAKIQIQGVGSQLETISMVLATQKKINTWKTRGKKKENLTNERKTKMKRWIMVDRTKFFHLFILFYSPCVVHSSSAHLLLSLLPFCPLVVLAWTSPSSNLYAWIRRFNAALLRLCLLVLASYFDWGCLEFVTKRISNDVWNKQFGLRFLLYFMDKRIFSWSRNVTQRNAVKWSI